jgi:hypothetical protein
MPTIAVGLSGGAAATYFGSWGFKGMPFNCLPNDTIPDGFKNSLKKSIDRPILQPGRCSPTTPWQNKEEGHGANGTPIG